MPAFPDPAPLRNVTLFHGLDDNQLNKINALLHRNRYPRGRTVLHAEQPGELVYVVYQGVVQVRIESTAFSAEGTASWTDASHAAVILALLGPGEVIGEMSVVDSLGRSATVITHEESTLLWMDRVSFRECMTTMPPLTYALTQVLTRRLRLANARIQALANLDVGGRVAYYLLALAQEHGEKKEDGSVRLPFRLTHEEIAELVGATRVRVTQVLSAWKKTRYLTSVRSGYITIQSPAALMRLCS